MTLFIMLIVVWGLSGCAYWLFHSMKTRRYNAYASGRLDTLYVVFMLMTLVMILSGVVMLEA